MHEASLVLFWFSFALYVAATVLYAYQFILRRPKVAGGRGSSPAPGFICQTLSIGANSIASDGTLLTGANQLILASWALVLLYFVMEPSSRSASYGAFLVPVAVHADDRAQLVGAAVRGIQPRSHRAAQLDRRVGHRVPRRAHRLRERGLRLRRGLLGALPLLEAASSRTTRSNRVSRRLPSLATLQSVARRSIALAFPVYTAGSRSA